MIIIGSVLIASKYLVTVLAFFGFAGFLIVSPKFNTLYKIQVNYPQSFLTTFDGKNYIVLNVTVSNKSDYPLNNIAFYTDPTYELLDNIWSKPVGTKAGSSCPYIGAMRLIDDSFGDLPISIPPKETSTGSLVFEACDEECRVKYLATNFLGNVTPVKIAPNKISKKSFYKTNQVRSFHQYSNI